MELEQQRTGNPAMTFDEVSMERSKNFVKALQELKNLRPQLYSAAEYCEKSYLRSEQKQMVLENLKDYAVRALVNAVDHLGTVAYKLTNLLEQQTSDVSTMEMKISCKNQQLLTCQIYSDKEGLRQQQLLAIIPRHHKHYILPLVSVVVDSKSDSAHKKVHFSSHVQTHAGERYLQERPHVQPSGTTASKTLSWHLASETKSTLKGIPRAVPRSEDSKFVAKNSDAEGNLGPASSAAIKTLGVPWQDSQESSKPLKAYRSFDNPTWRDSVRAPPRSKSMLSSLFVKEKAPKVKTSAVS